MSKLEIGELYKLEEYAEQRDSFRARVLAHKQQRKLALGPHMTLLFEDRLTIQYQVQEMLRVERLFEKAAIQQELDAYNPLIPDGRNWKATGLIEYAEVAERQRMLARLRGIEHGIWLQVGELPRITAIADEDMERSNEDKTSAVHFLRFELTAQAIEALRGGAALRFGVDHAEYRHSVVAPAATRESLMKDLA